MFKKFISMILTMVMLVTMCTVPVDAEPTVETGSPEDRLNAIYENYMSVVEPKDRASVEAVVDEIITVAGRMQGISLEEIMAGIKTYTEDTSTKLYAARQKATKGNYVLQDDNYYVAIGGNTVYGIGIGRKEKAYTDILKDDLGFAGKVLSEEGLGASDIVGFIEENSDEISKATLITYQLDASSFVMSLFDDEADWSACLYNDFALAIQFIVDQTVEIIKRDWTTYGNSLNTVAISTKIETNLPVKYKTVLENENVTVLSMVERTAMVFDIVVKKFKGDENATVASLTQGDVETLSLAYDMAEKFVVSIFTYMVKTVKALETIQDINPDALILLVGMYNPLQKLTISINGEITDVTNLFSYLIKVMDIYNTTYAFVDGNVVFVDVSETEANGINENIVLDEISAESIMSLASKITTLNTSMHANAAGHQYIYEQIKASMVIREPGYVEPTPVPTVAPTTEPVPVPTATPAPAVPAVLYGDADENGSVNAIDAMTVLQYSVETITEDKINLIAADVDGNSSVDAIDAMLILQYDVGLIEKFPVEK